MSLRQSKMAKLVVSSMLLSASLSVFAGEKQVTCPSIDKIQNSWDRLDTVTKFDNNWFFASTDKAAFEDTVNEISWHVGASARVSDFNSALVVGQKNLKSVTGLKRPILETPDSYYCYYNGNDVVAAWADKPVSGSSVKQVMMNLHS